MPKIKKAMSVLRLNKSRHRAVSRAINRNRKKRESEPDDAPEESLTEAVAQDDDAVENESNFSTERDPTPTSTNPRSSAVEENGAADRETSSLFSRLVYSEDILSALPNRTWAIHCVEIPEKRVVVSSMIMHNSHGTGLQPIYIKQIIFDEKLSFDLFIINSRLVPKDKPSSIRTMHDFEDLVDYVESLKICNGGPSVSQYSNVNPECAYKDPLDKWRHNLCTLEINSGDVCESCSSLDEILRRHVQRIKPSAKLRTQPSVKLRSPVIIPQRKSRLRD